MIRKFAFCTLIFYAMISISQAQDRIAFAKGEVAFGGYDLVGFFNNETLKGTASLEHEFMGVKLQFSSQENLDTFKSDPERYFPAYGGWCAIAMVDDSFVIPDYTLYKIQDDRLFFFQVKAFFNGLTYWNKDPDKNLFLADGNYRKHFDE